MARSNIIKQFTSSTISLEIILKKLIVLLNDLNDDRLITWARNELRGYDDADELPNYRIISGRIVGSYIVGSRFNGMQYTNAQFPISHLSKEIQENLQKSYVYQSISSLENIVTQQTNMQKPIDPGFFSIIQTGTNAKILQLQAEFDCTSLQDIISKVSDKVLEILLLLEKNFGNLDELELDLNTKESNDISKITNNIYYIIYEDNSITIGDNNKIKNTNLLSKFIGH